MKYLGTISFRAPDRKPFVTIKGNLGLGPNHIRRGDKVAVFGGADVPFILREAAPGKYQLLGEAYVDGIMDGEASDTTERPTMISLI